MNPEELLYQALHNLHWQQEPRGLYEPIDYAMQTGGKRLRPLLALIANKLCGGNLTDALPAALAIEIFHNFTLLHDDLMDNAPVRRGKPTVYKQYSANTAILSGDQMLIEAYKQLQDLKPEQIPTALSLFSKMATEICEGQQYDMDFEKRTDVTVSEYLEMIRLKTSVLLATALQLGAYIAGADDRKQQALYLFGQNLGMAFQLEDDLLDVYGNPDTFGKTIGGDILCAKKTYLLLRAYEKADTTQTEQLNTWLYNENVDREDKIRAVTNMYNILGVRQDTEKLMQQYTNSAIDALQQLDLMENDLLPLQSLAQTLLNRKL